MKNITVGYLRPEKESFISNIISTNNFLDALSHYVKVVTIATDFKKIDLCKLEDLNINYLLVDIKNFGPMQFILREKQQAQIHFIIMLHTIYFWFESLIYIVPLIKKKDIIIAPSEYAKNSFLKITGKLKVHVIPHCLDVKKIQKNISCNFNKYRKEIGFMGRLTEEKGIDILIGCMPELISRVGDVHLIIIGPLSGGGIKDFPKSPFVKELEREVIELGLTNYVHFMGFKLGLEKYRILSHLDIFVSPTISNETFNISSLEALACGVPVIATKGGVSQELIREGESGYLLNATYKSGKLTFDKEYLISLIVKVLKNKKINLKLKKNAMKTAQNFDYRKVMPKLVKLLKKRTKAKVKNRWEWLKNKRVTDFSHLFNRDFLFFLYYSHRFKTETYTLLYRRMMELAPLKNNDYLNVKRIFNRENAKCKDINNKIRQNLLDFLLQSYD